MRLQLWVPSVVKLWLRHVPRHVIAKWSKKRSPKIASRHVDTRHGNKNCELHATNVIIATMWGIFLQNKTRILPLIFQVLLPSENGRRSVTSCPPPSFSAQHAKTQFGNHLTTTCGNLFATSLPILSCTSPVALTSLSDAVRAVAG